jgi:hypothetical protein
MIDPVPYWLVGSCGNTGFSNADDVSAALTAYVYRYDVVLVPRTSSSVSPPFVLTTTWAAPTFAVFDTACGRSDTHDVAVDALHAAGAKYRYRVKSLAGASFTNVTVPSN